ncbi:hypothetical protein WKW80_18470 [Variovorax humicola]|uniref:Prolipoprotein diacylglyceryl transferase n=1 Tax=Variovorax humicola TaxID=1769758 RepID=A0ABU8W435_9BURK
MASTFEARWWGFFLAALILAAAGAEFVYVQFDLPQRYSELIVGAIAWNYGNKFHDYAVVHGPIASSMVALVFIGSLAARLKRDFGTEGVDKLHDFVFLLLRVPAGGWLAGVLSSKSEALALLHVAQLLILSGLLIGWCLSAGGAVLGTAGRVAVPRVADVDAVCGDGRAGGVGESGSMSRRTPARSFRS